MTTSFSSLLKFTFHSPFWITFIFLSLSLCLLFSVQFIFKHFIQKFMTPWSWILGFEICRRHNKIKYYFRKGTFCRFILYIYFIRNLQISVEVAPSLTHLCSAYSPISCQNTSCKRPRPHRPNLLHIYVQRNMCVREVKQRYQIRQRKRTDGWRYSRILNSSLHSSEWSVSQPDHLTLSNH